MHRLRADVIRIALSLTTLVAGSVQAAPNCDGDSTGMIPLIDLGAGLYQGAEGGLYAGGSNAPPPLHLSDGLEIAAAIAPLDTFGLADPNGSIVLVSIGLSNTTQEFSAFVPKALADTDRNSAVIPIDCAQGGQAAEDVIDPNAPYWDFVFNRLRVNGSSPLQPQVAWIKTANRAPMGAFPDQAEKLMRDIGSIVRLVKAKLPNVKLAYITSRIYAGYASTPLNPEPHAYESGFSVKWIIEGQIAGADSLNYDPSNGAVEAPWIAWGPYLWADGLNPRSDGLIWECAEFANDGTHPGPLARNKVADSLLAFFKSDPTAQPWFLTPGTVSVPEAGPAVDFSLAPNPAAAGVTLRFGTLPGVAWRVSVFDLTGRRAADVARGTGTGARELVRWNAPAKVRPGVYWAVLEPGRSRVMRRFVLLE